MQEKKRQSQSIFWVLVLVILAVFIVRSFSGRITGFQTVPPPPLGQCGCKEQAQAGETLSYDGCTGKDQAHCPPPKDNKFNYCTYIKKGTGEFPSVSVRRVECQWRPPENCVCPTEKFTEYWRKGLSPLILKSKNPADVRIANSKWTLAIDQATGQPKKPCPPQAFYCDSNQCTVVNSVSGKEMDISCGAA